MADTPESLFVDCSSNNALPNLSAYKTSGRRVLVIKATQGVGYGWTAGDDLARRAKTFGLFVWRYHFAAPGTSGTSQADYFLAHLNGDTAVLDMEGAGWKAGEAALVTRDFCARVQAKTGKAGYVYTGAYFITENQLRLPSGWRWWVASYTPTLPTAPPGWPTPTAWQYTEGAAVPGFTGGVDQSRFTTVPQPPPGVDDVTEQDKVDIVDEVVKRVANDTTHANTVAHLNARIDDMEAKLDKLLAR